LGPCQYPVPDGLVLVVVEKYIGDGRVLGGLELELEDLRQA